MENNIKVLMVEDSPSLSAIYQVYLEDSQYQVIAVESLGAAHASLGAFRPDIVLLDIELPDGNGMDFLADIQQLEEQDRPTVIVMTAMAHRIWQSALSATGLSTF